MPVREQDHTAGDQYSAVGQESYGVVAARIHQSAGGDKLSWRSGARLNCKLQTACENEGRRGRREKAA
jgi:hypothetical protein